MILLRRGRTVQQMGSSFDIDVTFELEPMTRRRRPECYAPWRPPIEVFETEHELVIRAEIGGLSSNEVGVLLDGDELLIRGERNVAQPSQQRLYHESRVRYGPFDARVRLPFPVDIQSAGAEYVDGFLTVKLPRLAATRVTTQEPGGQAVPSEKGGRR